MLRLATFIKEVSGNAALVFALAAVPVLGAVFGAVEISHTAAHRALLQDATDAGALAGAGRMSVVRSTGDEAVRQTAENVARQVLENGRIDHDVTFTTTIDPVKGTVTVHARADHKAMVGFMGLGDEVLHAEAMAENLGRVPLCVLQTGTNGKGGIDLGNTARIRATGCAVHANKHIKVAPSALIQADRTQANGTITGPVSPAGNSGAMNIPDPFASMNLKPPTLCDGRPEDLRIKTGVVEYLPPGIHCEHFKISTDATLVLMPGDHYFMDHLDAESNAIIRGDDVVLILGSTKKVNFAQRAQIELGARKSGPFSGFLIVTTRDNTQTFSISSDRVSKLLGTIYIPSATLEVSTVGSVAQDSAWSIIVAQNLVLKQNPNLVINNRYSGSGVPVPQGVGPNRNQPVLSK